MLFKPELARLVLAGRKTQTRRLTKPAVPDLPDEWTEEIRVRHARRHCFYRAGRYRDDGTFRPGTYPLERPLRVSEMSDTERRRVEQRRGRPPKTTIGRIDIVDVRLERLDDMTTTEARAEGFRTLTDFARYWLTLHDRAWPAIERVPCPDCLANPDFPADELPPCETCSGESDIDLEPIPSEEEVLARFRSRHGHKRVWAITFQLSRQHEPRYLAERSELGYVPAEYNDRGRRVALIGEPEALSDADHELHIAKEARERETARKDQQKLDLELVDVEERMRRARVEARMKHIDIRSELRLFREQREEGKPREAVIRTVSSVERRVYPEAA